MAESGYTSLTTWHVPFKETGMLHHDVGISHFSSQNRTLVYYYTGLKPFVPLLKLHELLIKFTGSA